MSEKTKALVLHNSIYIEQILQIGVKRKKKPSWNRKLILQVWRKII